jgi:hypothetical protein
MEDLSGQDSAPAPQILKSMIDFVGQEQTERLDLPARTHAQALPFRLIIAQRTGDAIIILPGGINPDI